MSKNKHTDHSAAPSEQGGDKKVLLQMKDLVIDFHTESGVVEAIDHVSYEVYEGETLGIVGESGCGKSVSSMAILRLIACPPGKITQGEILFEGTDLLKLNDAEIRHIRGNDISMIFQEPMTSLNPVFTIGFQLSEVLMLHRNLDKKKAWEEGIALLKKVGVPRAESVVEEYPFALSGGMRQRAMIAMALACNPKLLIADEPTTALDVTIQAQILDLMRKLKQDLGAAIMFITHDLSVIAEMADRVIVMYAGQVVEQATVSELFHNPLHPYTRGLLYSRPETNPGDERLHVIPGSVPNLLQRPQGCQFRERCYMAAEGCEARQELLEVVPGHLVRCFRCMEGGNR